MQKEFKKEGIKKVYLNCTLLILWFVYSGYWIIYFGISLLFIPTFSTKTKNKKAKTKRSEMRTKRIRKKVLMNKVMSSSVEFWATKHFMTPTAKHQGDWAKPTGKVGKPGKPHRKNHPVAQRESRSRRMKQ